MSRSLRSLCVHGVILLALAAGSWSAEESQERTVQDSHGLLAVLSATGMDGFIERLVNYRKFLTVDRDKDLRTLKGMFGDSSRYIAALGGVVKPSHAFLGTVAIGDVMLCHVYAIHLQRGQLLVALLWHKGETEYAIGKVLFGDTAEPYALRLARDIPAPAQP